MRSKTDFVLYTVDRELETVEHGLKFIEQVNSFCCGCGTCAIGKAIKDDEECPIDQLDLSSIEAALKAREKTLLDVKELLLKDEEANHD